ncbi:MAG: hypothetical protein ACIAS6_00680 [Phycisphaerales bacterium JB060]
MKASTLPMYLIGNRRAILNVARSPWSVLIGVLFVLSAGLAREYDGEYLVLEPWHALRPFGASLASGTLLFIIVHIAAMIGGNSAGSNERPPFFKEYFSWMGLFWMTAPMAWLYAIPYERWMSPEAAISCNLWTLAFVAAWRVVLMTRVITVVYGVSPVPAFFLVMLFADAVVIAVMGLAPLPVIDIMGGVRGPAREALLASVAFNVGALAILSLPLWALGALISLIGFKPMWPVVTHPQPTPSRGLLITAGISIVAFAPLLLWAQPEQALRHRVEKLLLSGRIDEGLAEMSAHPQARFPPDYDPPPRLGYRQTQPDLNAVRAAMRKRWPAEWVAELYLYKTRREIGRRYFSDPTEVPIAHFFLDTESEWALEQANEMRDEFEFLLEHDPSMPEANREAIRRLLEAADAQESSSDASTGPT